MKKTINNKNRKSKIFNQQKEKIYIFVLDKNGSIYCLSTKCDNQNSKFRIALDLSTTRNRDENVKKNYEKDINDVSLEKQNATNKTHHLNLIDYTDNISERNSVEMPVADLKLDRVIMAYDFNDPSSSFTFISLFCCCRDCCSYSDNHNSITTKSTTKKIKKTPTNSISTLTCNECHCLVAIENGQVGIFNYNCNQNIKSYSSYSKEDHIVVSSSSDQNRDFINREARYRFLSKRNGITQLCLYINNSQSRSNYINGKVYVLSGSKEGLIIISNLMDETKSSNHHHFFDCNSYSSRRLQQTFSQLQKERLSTSVNKDFSLLNYGLDRINEIELDNDEDIISLAVEWSSAICRMQSRVRIEQSTREEIELRRQENMAITDVDYQIRMAVILADIKLNSIRKKSQVSLTQAKKSVTKLKTCSLNNVICIYSVISGNLKIKIFEKIIIIKSK